MTVPPQDPQQQARQDEHGMPVGPPVPGWAARPPVVATTLVGEHVRLEPLRAEHAAELYEPMVVLSDPRIWTYYPYSPQMSRAEFDACIAKERGRPNGAAHLIRTADGAPQGFASYLRIDPANGSVEVGGIVYSSALQRTTAATEAMVLMARHVFDDLGYRRYEWKCDSLNAPSRAAAARLGFTYEGRFRNAMVYKGRNRDTDWFSITHAEWPAIAAGYTAWLAPDNFDDQGRRRTRLPELIAASGTWDNRPHAPTA